MKMIRDPRSTAPCVLVLGMFDGVHRGHQALLMRGVALAEEHGLPLNVCTFEPHPLTVLRPELAPPRLTTQTERAQLMAGFGVDSLCVMHFTRGRADQQPEDFAEEMVRVFRPKWVVCGFNFTFGRAGRGNGELLAAYGRTHGYETVIVPEVILEGSTVSSTRIRRLLESGRVHEASRLLGHAFTLTGRTQELSARGVTAVRVSVPRGKALPGDGAYACYMTVDGQHYPAVVWVRGGAVEASPLDSCLVLRGRQVRLTFARWLCADGEPQTDAAEKARSFFFSVE